MGACIKIPDRAAPQISNKQFKRSKFITEYSKKVLLADKIP